ncbi:MAG: hypothetical protein WCQ20_07155 [Synechococcaceae cyanobacterium ELA739]
MLIHTFSSSSSAKRLLAASFVTGKRDLRFALQSLITPNHRYLLCRPRGGFNDNLVQISRCLLYALRFRRVLLIDMCHAGQCQNLSLYFLSHPRSFRLVEIHDAELNYPFSDPFLVYPSALSSPLGKFFPVYDSVTNCHVDPLTLVPTTFDHNRDYPQQILLHEQCGGGSGWPTLERMRLQPDVAMKIASRISQLPTPYNAVHIRHSDVSTNVHLFLESIRPQLLLSALPVLIATDNSSVLQIAIGIFKGIEVVTLFEFPEGLLPGKSLHYSTSTSDFAGGVAVLTDLFALAFAQKLFLCSLTNGSLSGFGNLAADLMMRPHLLRRLFGSRLFSLLSPRGLIRH